MEQSEALVLLVDLLDLEQIEVNTFEVDTPKRSVSARFGGQVAAQALMAAGRTVEVGRGTPFTRTSCDRRSSIPILYEVDESVTGESFTTRRVVAIQHAARSTTCRPVFTRRGQY